MNTQKKTHLAQAVTLTVGTILTALFIYFNL